MKFSLIAIAACCAVTGSAFALNDNPGTNPPQFAQADNPGTSPPQFAQVDNPGTSPPQFV
ncbi:MAG: hypothetical protein ABSG18_11580 [Steroidobacteraceae bacterium]